MSSMSPMPALFVSHGSPMILIEPGPCHDFLTTLREYLPRPPRAIVSLSAHWPTEKPTVSFDATPETVHDFGGFPQKLYEMSYPVPGAPQTAKSAAHALHHARINYDEVTSHGLDHGTWVPLMLAYPNADIPVTQISIQPQKSARWHYALGQALAPLRKDDILILGSGSLTHNLSAMTHGGNETPPDWVTTFVDWIYDAITEKRTDDLLNFEKLAPQASQNHPTTEHLLPLFVAIGAAQGGNATRLHTSIDLGVLAMDAYRFA